jgi:hypothetical protein
MVRVAPFVVAARALIVAASAALAVGAIVAIHRPALAPVDAYACPMHPDVTAAEPGDCPICRMALERRTAVASPPPLPDQDVGATTVARRRTFSQPVRAPAWVHGAVVSAILSLDDLASLDPAERARFRPSSPAAKPVVVQRTAEEPAPWDEATALVTFAAAPGEGPLQADATGWLDLEERPRPRLVVPMTAVIQRETSALVLVVSGGRFAPREVRLGRVSQGVASVVAGLREGEAVVARGAWFLEADRRLSQPATPP